MNIFQALDELSLRVWQTKDGRIIALRDLNDRHLDNIIRMLERRYPGVEVADTEAFYLWGPPPNGEMAQMLWEQEVAAIADRVSFEALFVRPHYEALVKEKERRTNGRTESLASRAQGWATDRLATTYTRLHRGARHVVQRAPARSELAPREVAARALAFCRELVERRVGARGSHDHQEGATE